jgi:tetratricopeptide (TPR) repeat protein
VRYPKPLFYIAFLGVSFSKKEVEEKKATDFKMTDIKAELDQADVLFDENKFQETVNLLKNLDQSDAEVQWRLGRAIFKVSGTEANSTTKNELIKTAYGHLQEALEKEDNNFAIHKWYAILLDARSNLDGIKARITQLETVKKHMMRAIELNPTDSTSRYILGEFFFGLADLSWYEKKIVSALFAKPPDASYEEALQHFLKAEELKADFYSMNKLMIAKCYLAMKNNDQAKEFLSKASEITVQNEDDRKCKEEASKLLSKLK